MPEIVRHEEDFDLGSNGSHNIGFNTLKCTKLWG